MVSNLSQPVSSKATAKAVLFRLVSPMLRGVFRDNHWRAVSQLFAAVRAMGGAMEVQSTRYLDGMSGKQWILSIECNGFVFSGILTASFSDAPNGEVYDLTLTAD